MVIKTKGKNMCNICYANANKISMIKSNPETMCDEHYFEWCEEKGFAELSADEDYFHLV